MIKKLLLALFFIVSINCRQEVPSCDLLITNGIIFDGSGKESFPGIVAIKNAAIETCNLDFILNC